ncbi:MAG: MGMT family protein [Fimbriimonadaceae bacterium]|nr:MGMT family protein [Chthonomonadaceae bacterium]MCO5297591.1 MGMT family protein [Fimbriimonadaceae bacterium]
MTLDALWAIVRSIPEGKCASYGEVGAALFEPATGFQVGRWMARCPDDVPWWRVVSKQGRFPITRRHPSLGFQQRELLEREGVTFAGDAVDMAASGWIPPPQR